MALFQLILFVLLALNISTMLSGFMLARRMGLYLMNQVMVLMIAMMIGIVTLVVGLFFPPAPAMFDYLHIIILIDFILVLLGTLMQFGQILPTLMKTMQGGPFHSSHMTNLLVTLFLLLGLVIYYVELAVM
jgi:nitrogen fixation/metabolism regulation signal transduction histidine kinase